MHPWPEPPNIYKVYALKWNMGCYGASSQKPQRGWTNNFAFLSLETGKWIPSILKGKKKVETVKKTVSKTGKPGYVGTKALKDTQY